MHSVEERPTCADGNLLLLAEERHRAEVGVLEGHDGGVAVTPH